MTKQRELYEHGANPKQTQEFVTIGTVVDTNDPQQMGRVRVICPQWGDSWSSQIEDLPWALYMSPFGGQTQIGTRGPGIQESQGGVSYGMWAVPKVGAQVAVLCIDGNPMTRMYFGCIFDQFTPHTMPHGRYMYDDHPELEKSGPSPFPLGPYTSTEKLIQPLSDNLKQSFGNKGEANYEYRSRGADYSVAGVAVDQLNQTYSQVQDDKGVTHDGWTSTQGYQVSRSDPHAPSSYADKNYDSMTYSFTTPGFHALSMDDRQENCRVRLRTTSGHQILMDDTNERIYIATARGNNWVELDQDGNIDVFTTNKVNIHAARDINMTSDESIRLYAKKGIHMHSNDEIRMEAKADIHVRTAQNLRVHSTQSTLLQSDGALHFKTTAGAFLEATDNINVKSGAQINMQASAINVKADSTLSAQAATVNVLGDSSVSVSSSTTNVIGSTTLNLNGSMVNILGSTMILQTAPTIHLNGPPATPGTPAEAAASAVAAQPPDEQPAFWTNRVPDHEPYARVMTKHDFTHEPEFAYTDPSVGKSERGRRINRGMYWRR